MQYLSNSCYRELKSAASTLSTQRPGYVKFDHVILKELKRSLLGDEDLTTISFAGAQADVDTLGILQMLGNLRRVWSF